MNFIHMALTLFNLLVFRRSLMMKQITIVLFQCIFAITTINLWNPNPDICIYKFSITLEPKCWW